jgi:ABC-type dipeptide/oligopeptide/nickel transport system permease subunit
VGDTPDMLAPSAACLQNLLGSTHSGRWELVKRSTKVLVIAGVAVAAVAVLASSLVGALAGILGAILKLVLVPILVIAALVASRHWIGRYRARR